jgi:hypothetical protein
MMNRSFLDTLTEIFSFRESALPPDVSGSARYSYNNYRGDGCARLGPRAELKAGNDLRMESNKHDGPSIQRCMP